MQTQGVQGWPATVCPSCGAVTLDAQAARQILGPEAVPRPPSLPGSRWYAASDPAMSSDADLAQHIERLRATRQRRLTLLVGAATVVVVVLLAVPLAFVVYATVQRQLAASVPAGPTLTETIASTPVVAVAPPPASALVAEDAPPPAAPEPVPPVPGPVSVRALVSQGWTLADKDPAEAGARFRAALARAPSDPEANYGVGYTALKLGDRDTAARHMCAAMPDADLDMRREIEAFQSKYQITCP